MATQDRQPSPTVPGHPPAQTAGQWARPIVLVLGVVFLATCVGMSLLLVLEHLAGLSLPGCGAGSPCAQAAASVWGKVPVINWPTSFLGLAYFLAVSAAWLAARGRPPPALRMVVRLGALLSLGFVVIMVRGGYTCPYCLAAHLGNFAFWALVELSGRARVVLFRPAAAFCTTFVLASAILGLANHRWRHAARAEAEQQMQASGEAILAAAQRGEDAADDGPAAADPTTAPADTAAAPAEAPAARSFTGRYRLGPEESPIRIVIFSDYTCVGCHIIELETEALFERQPTISVSVKQWPGDRACNPHGTEGKHLNACAAARAAEAAGLLGGNDAFWKMHFWLFKKNGRFTEEELRAAAQEFGHDPDEFERVWQSDATLELVLADIEEGFGLGLRSTPTIFINGMEFKGWSAPLALTRVVEKLIEANLPVRTAAHDRPMTAVESYVADWRNARGRELPGQDRGWTQGPADAGLKIVVWGDYQQPNTALADGIIREFVSGRSDTRYTFHVYPLSTACNPAAKEDTHPLACRAALAAYAAGTLGGPDAYWKMHDWLLRNQPQFSDDALPAAATAAGLDPAALLAAMEDPETLAAVAADAAAGQQAGLQNSPLMFINHKVIPRWLHGGQPMLRAILDAAAQSEPGP